VGRERKVTRPPAAPIGLCRASIAAFSAMSCAPVASTSARTGCSCAKVRFAHPLLLPGAAARPVPGRPTPGQAATGADPQQWRGSAEPRWGQAADPASIRRSPEQESTAGSVRVMAAAPPAARPLSLEQARAGRRSLGRANPPRSPPGPNQPACRGSRISRLQASLSPQGLGDATKRRLEPKNNSNPHRAHSADLAAPEVQATAQRLIQGPRVRRAGDDLNSVFPWRNQGSARDHGLALDQGGLEVRWRGRRQPAAAQSPALATLGGSSLSRSRAGDRKTPRPIPHQRPGSRSRAASRGKGRVGSAKGR